jgi:hypothetical protein
LDETQQELFLGKKITVQTIPGREGKTIGRFPDGRIILFDQSSPYSKMLAPGQSVECHVENIHEKYVIVNPIREPDAIEASPAPEVNMNNIVEDLDNLVRETAGVDSDKIIEDLEKMIGKVSKNAKVIPKALIHVIRLEQLIIKILTGRTLEK